MLIRVFVVVLSNSCDGKDIKDLMFFGGSNKISQISYSNFKVQNGWLVLSPCSIYLFNKK